MNRQQMNSKFMVPFRVTVRGGGLPEELLQTAVKAIACQLREASITLKLRVGDGVFDTLARNAGKCYCHAELGPQKEALFALQSEFPRSSLDEPPRLWGVIQERFDLLRSLCDTDAVLLFPPDESQFAEFAYMLAEIGRNSHVMPFALVGWTTSQLRLLQQILSPDIAKAIQMQRFSLNQTGEILTFLRQSEVFMARTAS